jgi:serine dehydratase alpha subunit
MGEIDAAMMACIDRGLRGEGALPGRLNVKRRAKSLLKRLQSRRSSNVRPPHEILDWVSLYAIAVNEENAAGGRVVTAPTNGAAGVLPEILRYYRESCAGASAEGARTFLARRNGSWCPHQDECVNLGCRDRLPGRGRSGLLYGGGGPRCCHGRGPTRRTRTPPRSVWSIISGRLATRSAGWSRSRNSYTSGLAKPASARK